MISDIVAAMAVIALQSWLGQLCPLTVWEQALRQRAGEATYRASFVEHWLSALLYVEAPWWAFVLGYSLLLALVAWGICGFGMMAPQQSRLASVSPPQAPLLLSLNTSMLYFGTALGAAVGGMGSPVLGFDHLPWLGAVFAGLGLLVLLTSPAAPAVLPQRVMP